MGKVRARTTWDYELSLDDRVVDQFRASMCGEVIGTNHAAYDIARRVYNGMIDKHPCLIARCVDVADVICTVNFARENGLLLAVRGGGHNGAGLGTCDNGVVLDLSLMKGVRVDPERHTVRVDGGCTQGEVNHAAAVFGLAVPPGVVSSTGIGGLTLGGGHGYLTRKHGLTIDNLLEADVILADGSLAVASRERNEDLFWAIRGGGGNFGVVTSFLFRAHPVDEVTAGPMFWDVSQTAEIMRWYRQYMPTAPEDVYGFFALMNILPAPAFPSHLHGRPACAVVWCHLGPAEQAKNDLDAVRRLHPPLFEHVGPMSFLAVQSMLDPLLPPGLQWYWKGDFVNELSDEAIEQHIYYGSRLPNMLSAMHMYPIDGRAQRVAPDATAFSYRDANWSMVIDGIDPDPANKGAITQWARDYWDAVHPYCAGGGYVNFMMEEAADRVQATYRGNYDRLTAIKARYDPGNLFRVNQNIPPRS